MADERPTSAPKQNGRPDLATILGVVIAAGGVTGGLIMEGGKLADVTQFTAAIIVVGGTVGAVMISTPMTVLLGAGKRLIGVARETAQSRAALIEELIGLASRARKLGLVSLEQEAMALPDPFMRKAMTLAIDGTDLQDLHKMLQLEIDLTQHQAESEAKVFELAGGYSPTVGIIGAVLGLIQVMKNLANIDEVGHGIAVSFVATVYGVGLANLLFLPVATKIKSRARLESERKELILEGVSSIVEGLNPKLIRAKLEAYAAGGTAKKSAESSPAGAQTPAEAEI